MRSFGVFGLCENAIFALPQGLFLAVTAAENIIRCECILALCALTVVTSQFTSESFDVIVDKGGLDALMEPKLGPKLGNQYLAEVFWTHTSQCNLSIYDVSFMHVLQKYTSRLKYMYIF